MPNRQSYLTHNQLERSISNLRSVLFILFYYMSHATRKPVFGVSDQVRHKPACAATELGRGLKFRI